MHRIKRNKYTSIPCANTFCVELFKVIVLLNFHNVLSQSAGVFVHHAVEATATPFQQTNAGDSGPAPRVKAGFVSTMFLDY
jgi:hypothetical protein